jgi:hypothetical protein
MRCEPVRLERKLPRPTRRGPMIGDAGAPTL